MTDELLDLAGYKALVTTSASDEAITAALAASLEAIDEFAGPAGDITEHILGGHNHLSLGRRARAVVSVIERRGGTLTELDPADYALVPSGGSLTRLLGGPNPSSVWRGQVEVVYEGYIGLATRISVQLELVALEVGDTIGPSSGARTSERIGEWSETWASSTMALTPAERRKHILNRLASPMLTYWSGAGHSALPGISGS